MSLELKTIALVAVALGVFYLVVTRWLAPGSTWQLAIAVVVVFTVIALIFDVWVYRPLNGLIRRSRTRLGGDYEHSDPSYRDGVPRAGIPGGYAGRRLHGRRGQGVGVAEHQGPTWSASRPSTGS